MRSESTKPHLAGIRNHTDKNELLKFLFFCLGQQA